MKFFDWHSMRFRLVGNIHDCYTFELVEEPFTVDAVEVVDRTHEKENKIERRQKLEHRNYERCSSPLQEGCEESRTVDG